jgi:RNA 3'-terminal phosphate cyclase
MHRTIRSTLLLLAVLATAGVALGQTLSVTFRGVTGGVNAPTVQWINES